LKSPPEEEITEAVAQWLEERDWEIIATHHPGTQGGFRLKGDANKGEGDIIPDVVAVRGWTVLAVESKPTFDKSDLHKVVRIAEDCGYRSELEALIANRHLSEADSAKVVVLVGLAFSGPIPSDIPHSIIVFLYVNGTISVVHDPDNMVL